MKVTPIGAQNTTTATTGQSAREKAIAAFADPAKVQAVKAALSGHPTTSPAQSQETPVANPNHVSAEELSAIQAPTEEVQETETTEESDNTADTETSIREEATKDPETERRFQQIAKQERVLRAKIQQANQQLKQREADLKAKETELESKYKPQDLSQYVHKDRIKAEADLVLDEAGVNWDELTSRVINRQPTDPRVMSTIQRLEAQLADMKNEVAENKKAASEQQTQSYQAALTQIRHDAQHLVKSAPEEYEAINAHNAIDDVVKLVEKTYQKHGRVLSTEDAAKQVEEFLIEEALRITDLKKVQTRREALKASKLKTETKPQASQQTQMKTLTNAASSQRPLTARERAIAAMEGKLKT